MVPVLLLASFATHFRAYKFLAWYGYRYFGNLLFWYFWDFRILAFCFIMYLIISLLWGFDFWASLGLGSELD